MYSGLTVGERGAAILGVSRGAKARTNAGNAATETALTLGLIDGGFGYAFVSGSGSELKVNGQVNVGVFGDGYLRVDNGGLLTSTNGNVKSAQGAVGTVVVDGPGSAWRIEERLDLGSESISSNQLAISSGGLVTAGQDVSLGRYGVIDISGPGSKLIVGRGASVAQTNGVHILGDGRLSGRGTINSTLTNGGFLRDRRFAGILTINGDYNQGPNGVLQIEVGGDTAGNGQNNHDQLLVSGVATLGGRLEVPFYNGFVPTPGNEIEFVRANGGVVGKFSSTLFSSDYDNSVAQEIVYEPGSATTPGRAKLRFTTPESTIKFVSANPTAIWSNNMGTWSENGVDSVPDSLNPVVVTNESIGSLPQTVNVQALTNTGAINAAHTLEVGEPDSNEGDIVLSIDSTSLSVTADTMIKNNGAIELSKADSVLASAGCRSLQVAY